MREAGRSAIVVARIAVLRGFPRKHIQTQNELTRDTGL